MVADASAGAGGTGMAASCDAARPARRSISAIQPTSRPATKPRHGRATIEPRFIGGMLAPTSGCATADEPVLASVHERFKRAE